jgi:chromosomal replication initiation ATPase DnaA
MIDIEITNEKRQTLRFTNVPDEAIPGIKKYMRYKLGRKNNVKQKLDNLFSHVCKIQKIDPALVIKPGRKGPVVVARQLFCFLAYEKYGFYSTDVAKYLNMDHSSILHNAKNFQNFLDAGDALAIDALTAIAPRMLREVSVN